MTAYDDLMSFEFPEFEQTYTQRDTMLYALGVGAGCDPLDPLDLRLAFEKDLVAIPAMAVTLAYPGFWYRDLDPGLDFLRTVHGSERFVIHDTLPLAATVTARPRIVAIHDKGPGRGSLVVSERDIADKATGKLLATVTQTAFCRGDGGLGGPILPAPAPLAVPDRGPDSTTRLPISPQAALIYRLSGDYNPLHVDPDFARAAGFDRPILHGLSTYGHICRALMRLADPDENRIVTMDCRFTGPVFPGETLSLSIWQEGPTVHFRADVGDRRVIDNGLCLFEREMSG
ncbi:3-alpha,7-alpha,12-alpha-trihydroxy-5-beta-cholest-24-enoyl-CoA hydratase [Zhengella mangrovi]|uniref:3-alpha,7-alpha, 12-alpha-trihydroxy-5-beta-cholest-24-enoyl-CoA hydratase n=1 Tax=Zhengella mangrovi TaxID=1982044 RepID=A0A2G1QQG1_9HYPH|nr:MaoC/PaaZ C-terminal domain-containing protein [Zhengella mangrovi]PHP67766.1 3-alpha,7-alpha,12-alpha-trihydroxy-5-beta-cholest-24-enoyl-CoA hydratase [Zhengella mangrovi]